MRPREDLKADSDEFRTTAYRHSIFLWTKARDGRRCAFGGIWSCGRVC
jgi:hypothetical protein